MPNSKIVPGDLTSLAKELEFMSEGDINNIVDRFDEIIYMLLYIDTEVINLERIKDAAYDLKHIRDSLKIDLVAKRTQVVPIGVVSVA